MTSKNSFFKLLKEALKSRLWAIALTGLAFFFAFPVAVSMMSRSLMNREDMLERITQWFMFENSLVVVLVIAASVICGMGSFGYLNSKSRVDFYHSLPVKRETLYLVNYIAGIIIFALPYAVMLVAGAVVAVLQGNATALLGKEAVVAYLLNMIYYTLMYSVVIIAVMMTGNRIIAYLGAMFFNFVVPSAATIVMGYFPTFFETWPYRYNGGMEIFQHFSPIIEYITRTGGYRWLGMPAAALIVTVLVTAAAAVLGGILYLKRPSEAAGRAMVFEITKPVIRIITVMISTLSFGLFLWSIDYSIGWAVFGILCGGIIAHCVIEIIYHFEFKKLFSHKGQLAGCLIVSFAFFCVFRFDWFGYDSYRPKASQISNAAITAPFVTEWTSYGEMMDDGDGYYYWNAVNESEYIFENMTDADKNVILELAEVGVLNARESRNSHYQYGDTVRVCYTLNSGRKVYRNYSMTYDEMRDALAKLYLRPEFKKGIYPLMTLDISDIAEIRYREWEPERRLKDLTTDQKEALLQAYQQDLTQLSLYQMEEEMPVGLIRFVKNQEMPGLNESERERKEAERQNRYYGDYNQLEERNFYPVYRSFTRTCQLLAQYEITPGNDLLRTPTEYYKVSADWIGSRDKSDPWEYLIDDEDQIKELDALVLPIGLTYYNQICETSPYQLICYKMQGDRQEEISVVIPENQLPEFISELLQADEGWQEGE